MKTDLGLLIDWMPTFLRMALSEPDLYIGFMTLVGTFLIAYVTQRRKRLFFDVLHEETHPPLSTLRQKIRIYRRNEYGVYKYVPRRKEQPFRMQLVVEVTNVVGSRFGSLMGGTDITPDRVVKSLSLEFSTRSEIREAHVVDRSPADLDAEIVVEPGQQNVLTIQNTLLNQGDWFRLKLIVENPKLRASEKWWLPTQLKLCQVEGRGRIVGIKNFQKRLTSQELEHTALLLLIVVGVVQASFGLLGTLLQDPVLIYGGPLPLIGAQAAMVVMATVLFRNARRKTRRALNYW